MTNMAVFRQVVLNVIRFSHILWSYKYKLFREDTKYVFFAGRNISLEHCQIGPSCFCFLKEMILSRKQVSRSFSTIGMEKGPHLSVVWVLQYCCSQSQYRIIWRKAKPCFVLKMCILSLIHAFHAKVAQQLPTFITVMWVTASTTRELIRERDFGHNQIEVQMVIGNSTIIGSARLYNAFWFCYLNAICLNIWRKNIGLLEETKQDYVALSKASTDEFLWRSE